MEDDWKPLLTIWPWELWGRTDQSWLMLTRDRVVRWEWRRRQKAGHTVFWIGSDGNVYTIIGGQVVKL